MAAHAAPPYSGSPTRRATVATPSYSTGSRVSLASAAIAASERRCHDVTASTARQRSVGDDLSAGSSFTVEPAGRSRSVCHRRLYAAPHCYPSLRRAARRCVKRQQHALRRLRP
eukprot:1312336-Pleurochrysis_carterae.AAC.5